MILPDIIEAQVDEWGFKDVLTALSIVASRKAKKSHEKGQDFKLTIDYDRLALQLDKLYFLNSYTGSEE